LSLPSRLLSFVRDARWLDDKRVRAYSLILLAISTIGFAAWVIMAPHGIDRAGKPLGPDFMSFYAASKLALSGYAANAWNPVAHQAAEDSIFGRPLGYWAFFYPPAYLLLCWPLALLPYGLALPAWLGATTTAAVVLLRRWAKDVPWIVLLAFPALWLNLGNGQNAALFTALMAGG
jgi:alpha-1,2-mannosyltransferase